MPGLLKPFYKKCLLQLQKNWQNVCLLQKQVYICNASEIKYYSNYPTDYPPIIFYHPQKNAQASNSLLKSCIVNY